MSVGGRVVDVEIAADRVWVNTGDGAGRRACAIFVERDARAECIAVGDSLWWQGRRAMWTARSAGSAREVVLRRIGYSGVCRPSITALASGAKGTP